MILSYSGVFVNERLKNILSRVRREMSAPLTEGYRPCARIKTTHQALRATFPHKGRQKPPSAQYK